MYARSTTMRGDPKRLDEGIALVRDEIMPTVERLSGCVGMSLLVDRVTGTSIVTSAWESEDAMRSTEGKVEPLRQRGADLLSARPEVRTWEIAVLHREQSAPDGACATVTWTRGDANNIDRNLDAFRDQVMPMLTEMEGFCSLSLFVDRDEGLGVTALVFRDRSSLERARPDLDMIRAGTTERLGLDIVDVGEFDVAYARLRVPETV